MATRVQEGFKIIAQLDGTTLNGRLRVENTALIQSYSDSGTYIPNFETLSDDMKPAVVPVITNISSGALMVPGVLRWYYNGVELTFDSTTNLSTNSGMEGIFKLDKLYKTSYDNSDVTVTALRVVKNLVPLSGYDNDRISISGQVEVNGYPISFEDIGTTVIIQKATGASFVVGITPSGDTFTRNHRSATFKATLSDASGTVDTSTGYTFYWRKINVDGGDEALASPSTTDTQTVTADDIDNYGIIACTVSDNDGNELGTGWAILQDQSDPIAVNINMTGITGDKIRPGETATITPVAAYRDTGDTVDIQTWTWHLYDQAGRDFVPSGKDSAVFDAASINVSYNDVATRAGGSINGFVSATV